MATMTSSPNDSTSEADLMTSSDAAGVSILFLCILTITGNVLLFYALRKLWQTNHKFNSVHVIIGIFTCLELSFAAIPEVIFTIAFLSPWRLDSSEVWCNFTGWFAFASKTACAFITAILILERYVELCIPSSRPSRLRHIVKTQKYWAIRVILLTCFIATIPLFYGSDMVSLEGTGSYCHIDYTSKRTASFAYAICLCIFGYLLLQFILFCFVSILCQPNLKKEPCSNTHDGTHNRYFIGTTPESRRTGTPLSPSKYALDHPSFFETMYNDRTTQNQHFTRMILALIAWYWACLLPYLVVMTLALAGHPITGTTDFTVGTILVINSAVTPYLIISLYPPYWHHLQGVLGGLSKHDKRKEPLRNSIVSSPDELPHSLSIAYDETSAAAQSLRLRSEALPSSPWQPNGTIAHPQQFSDNGQMNDRQAVQFEDKVGHEVQIHPGSNELVRVEEHIYDNAGFLPDVQQHSKVAGDQEEQHSSGTGSYYTEDDGDSTESECSACDLVDDYPHVVFMDMPNHYYYPSRMPIYSTRPMGQVLYHQDPHNPGILYAMNTPPGNMATTLPPGRILGRAELRKMTKKGKTPPTIYTRENIPCETSLYSHNYRAPSFLKQYQGRAGWKEAIEIERRALTNAPASEGDDRSHGAWDEFNIERRNTWSGAILKSRQREAMVRAGVDRQASYRLAMGDDDFIDRSLEFPSNPLKNDYAIDVEPHPLIEQDLVLQGVKVEDPLSMNMAFQKVIAKDSASTGSSQRSDSSKGSRGVLQKDHLFVNVNHSNKEIGNERNSHDPPQNNLSDENPVILQENTEHSTRSHIDVKTNLHDDDQATSCIHIDGEILQESNDNESVERCITKSGDRNELDNVSLSSFKSDVSYRQYVRTIESVTNSPDKYSVPSIEITPAKVSSQGSDSDSDSDTDSYHSVESLLHVFSMGIGKLPVPSLKKAKDMENLKKEEVSGVESEDEVTEDLAKVIVKPMSNNDTEIDPSDDGFDNISFATDADNDTEIDPSDDGFDNISFATDADIAFADDLTAEFDRELAKRTAMIKESRPTSQEDTDTKKSNDQAITDQIRMVVEHIVEDTIDTESDNTRSTITVQETCPETACGDLATQNAKCHSLEAETMTPVQNPVILDDTSQAFDSEECQDVNGQENVKRQIGPNGHSDAETTLADTLDEKTDTKQSADKPAGIQTSSLGKENIPESSKDTFLQSHLDEHTIQELTHVQYQNQETNNKELCQKDSTTDTEISDNTSKDLQTNHVDGINKLVGSSISTEDNLSKSITLVVECEPDIEEKPNKVNDSLESCSITYALRYHYTENVHNRTKNSMDLDEAIGKENNVESILMDQEHPNDTESGLVINDQSHGLCESKGNHVNDSVTQIKPSAKMQKTVQTTRNAIINPVPQSQQTEANDMDEVRKKEKKQTTKHLWKRYHNAILKFSKDKRHSPVKDKSKSRSQNDNYSSQTETVSRNSSAEIIPQEHMTHSSKKMVNDEENGAGIKIGKTSPVLPGVSPRKQSPRSLWKKYRKDMLTVSKEIEVDDPSQLNSNDIKGWVPMKPKHLQMGKSFGNIKEENANDNVDSRVTFPHVINNDKDAGTSAPYAKSKEFGNKNKLTAATASIDSTPATLPELTHQSDVHTNVKLDKTGTSPTRTTEGAIWDTIEQTAMPVKDSHNGSVDDHHLFTKIFESPQDKKKMTSGAEPDAKLPSTKQSNTSANSGDQQTPNVDVNSADIAHCAQGQPYAVSIKDNMNNCDNLDLKLKTVQASPKEDITVVDHANTNVTQVNIADMIIEQSGQTDSSDSPQSTMSSCSSDDLSSISRCISAYSLDTSNFGSEMTLSSLENSTNRYQKSPRRYSIDTSSPILNGYCLDMSVCSGETEDMSVCSGELSDSNMSQILTNKHIPELVARKRRSSLPSHIVLERQDVLLDASVML